MRRNPITLEVKHVHTEAGQCLGYLRHLTSTTESQLHPRCTPPLTTTRGTSKDMTYEISEKGTEQGQSGEDPVGSGIGTPKTRVQRTEENLSEFPYVGVARGHGTPI